MDYRAFTEALASNAPTPGGGGAAALVGAVGAAMGTALSLLVANGLIMNIFYHKVLKIDMKYFWKEIFKTFKGLVIPIITATLIMRFIPVENMWVFFISVCIFMVVYCTSVFTLSCNNEEKNMLLSIIGKIKR